MSLKGSGRSDHSLIKGIIPVFTWRTEENHEKHQLGYQVSLSRFETRVSRKEAGRYICFSIGRGYKSVRVTFYRSPFNIFVVFSHSFIGISKWNFCKENFECVRTFPTELHIQSTPSFKS